MLCVDLSAQDTAHMPPGPTDTKDGSSDSKVAEGPCDVAWQHLDISGSSGSTTGDGNGNMPNHGKVLEYLFGCALPHSHGQQSWCIDGIV